MIIRLAKNQDTNQVYLNKQNLIILHWVKFLIRGSKKKAKRRTFEELRNIEGKNEEKLKAIEDQGKKQLDAIKNIKNKNR